MKKPLLILLFFPLLFLTCKKEDSTNSLDNASASIIGEWNLKEANALTSYGHYNGSSQVLDSSFTEHWNRDSTNGMYLNFLTNGTFEGQESDDWSGTGDTSNYTLYTKNGNQLSLLWDWDEALIFTIDILTSSTLKISCFWNVDFGSSLIKFERIEMDLEYSRTISP